MNIAEKLQQIAENEQKVFDTGKKAEYDTFWDAVQENGNRTNYAFAFAGDAWVQENFKPKYPIRPTQANNCFAYWGFGAFNSKRIDFRDLFELDTSSCTNLNSLCYLNQCITAVGVIDATKTNTVDSSFSNCYNLETIEKIILKDDGTQTFNRVCSSCDQLINLTIEGVIGQNGFSVQQSTKLSKASWISIINALSTTTSGLSITGSLASVKKAFETSEGANDGNTSPEWLALTATKSNWTISLV